MRRGDRMIGQARGSYEEVHRNVNYDLVFDTSAEPLDSIVQKIKARACHYGK